jgi:dsDNA-specific endonuclease/ATPase MutS2
MFEREYLELIEYPKVTAMLADLTRTKAARQRAENLRPTEDGEAVLRAQALTASARKVYEAMGEPPVHSLAGLDALNDKLRLGEILTAAELIAIGDFLNHCRLLKNYLKRALTIDPEAPSLGMSVDPLEALRKEIERCFRGERLDDRASPQLFSIRSGIERLAAKIKDRLASMMRAHPEWFQESFYGVRGRRYVLPVRRECAKLVRGHTLDISGSGQTVFIEPEAAASLRDEMESLMIDEANEEIRILSELSFSAAAAREALLINRESMEKLDYAFACGILASKMRCGELAIAKGFELRLESARHPLLGEGAVPMSLTLGGRVRALVITGPNTGGKTVSIKTAGLIAAMALSGLKVPAERAAVPLFAGIYCDIGDGQSVSQNLSTFSAHMRRVVRILAAAGPRALVLLDEVGSGTDPQEGMGLAVAILAELGRMKCLLMATSHYAELKRFAAETPGFLNARMTFDRATLSPTYHLELGEAGESCALDIARGLGMPEKLLAAARAAAYPSGRVQPAPKTTATFIPDEPEPADLMEDVAPFEAEPDRAAEILKTADRDAPTAVPAPPPFAPGDRVRVPFMNCLATVVLPPNARGEMLLRIRDKNVSIGAKRVEPFLAKDALYPGEDYDLDIVLDTWDNRKKRNQMRKGHTGVSVEARPGER